MHVHDAHLPPALAPHRPIRRLHARMGACMHVYDACVYDAHLPLGRLHRVARGICLLDSSEDRLVLRCSDLVSSAQQLCVMSISTGHMCHRLALRF